MHDTRTLQTEKGILEYIVENCERAFDELQRLNAELHAARAASDVDVGHMGDMHRIVQDYLVVRVAGLFDKRADVISFAKWFSDDSSYKQIQKEEIIQDLIKTRHNFVAHNNQENINRNFFPDTEKILNSNLRPLLERLKNLLKS
ncbi:MAG: hypothetical protein NUV84_05290 [Candidatus Uhrbacteria bacterium]|nr:hypothetical protein [Candidatus Uhrbacteria bacterium]